MVVVVFFFIHDYNVLNRFITKKINLKKCRGGDSSSGIAPGFIAISGTDGVFELNKTMKEILEKIYLYAADGLCNPQKLLKIRRALEVINNNLSVI